MDNQKTYALYEEIDGKGKKLIYVTDTFEDMKNFINQKQFQNFKLRSREDEEIYFDEKDFIE
ncbi:MAG: hypothetical protein ACOCUI_03310 [bacterium]